MNSIRHWRGLFAVVLVVCAIASAMLKDKDLAVPFVCGALISLLVLQGLKLWESSSGDGAAGSDCDGSDGGCGDGGGGGDGGD